MKNLIYALFLTLILQSCGGSSEENVAADLSGDYKYVSLIVGEVSLPSANLDVNLKSDNTYTSNGFEVIDTEIKSEGSWGYDDATKTLDLSGMKFEVKKFEDDTLKLLINSHSVDFTVTLKR